jgi:DNA polymerase-3 subunit beta
MEFSCSRGILFDTLAMVSGVVKKNPPLPVLSNVLVKADAEEGRLHLSATDLEVGVSCGVSAQVSSGGELTLPARKLTDILRELPEAQVTLVTEGSRCTVTCENSRFSLVGIDAEEFPPRPEVAPESTLSVDSDTIREMIRETLFAVSYDETRYFLNGVYMVARGNDLVFVATDGRRLAKSTRTLDSGVELDFAGIVPTKAVAEMDKLAAKVERVELSLGPGHIVGAFADTVLTASLIEGEYPDYDKLIPKEFPRKARLNRGLFEDATRRVALMADETSHRVAYEFEGNQIRVTGKSEQGEAVETVEAGYEGEPLRIGFNARYVGDALKATDAPEIELLLLENLRPGLLRGEGSEDYLCLIMPMRLDDF